MVYDNRRKDLRQFQRWVAMGLYRAVRWEDYVPNARREHLRAPDPMPLFPEAGLTDSSVS